MPEYNRRRAVHKILIPDGMYENIYKITPSLLSKRGKEAVVFDLDNTVAPYEVTTPTEKMRQYFAGLSKAGIEAAFVSNNGSERTDLFNSELGLFCVPDAGKPRPYGIAKCIAHFDLPEKNIVLVGDQIFTDCLAAHRAGLEFWLVKPIKDKETWFFKVKRFFEKRYIDAYKKRLAEYRARKRDEKRKAKEIRTRRKEDKKNGKRRFRSGR